MTKEARVANAFDYPGFVEAHMPPLFCTGKGPSLSLPISRRCGGENRQLSIESTLEGRPRFAADDIGGEVRIQHPRSVQPAQHRHHQNITGAERTIEPVGIAKARGKFAEPVTDAALDPRNDGIDLRVRRHLAEHTTARLSGKRRSFCQAVWTDCRMYCVWNS